MRMSDGYRRWSRVFSLVAGAALVVSTLRSAPTGAASAAAGRVAGAATRYAGWAMEAYPGDTTADLKTQMQRQIDAGANVVWLGQDNPGDVGYDKREPALSFAVWMAYRDPQALRHRDAVAMVQAQQHALAAAQALHLPLILPIGYQTQMGLAWNLAHPMDARRLANGSSYDGPNPINIGAAFQSPDYQHDIVAYYRWIDTTFVRPFARTILMLNLADEPQGGDYSTWADRAFRASHGYGLRQAGSDPARQEAVGRFESDYAVDYAAWSARQWLSIDPAVGVTMSFDGGYGRSMYEGPDLEDIFRAAPANFVVTFDAFPRDGLFTTPLHDSDLVELFNFVRTLGYYSAVYRRPLWLWSAANSWGLNEASSDPGNIADAVANGIYLAQLARQTGGDLQGIAVWNYNIKGQGLYNDTHHTIYDPDQMFARVSASFPLLRSIMAAPAGQADTVVLAPNVAELRAAGADLLLRAKDPYDWAALAAPARTNVAAVIVPDLDLSALPALRTVLVLAPTVADMTAADLGALSDVLSRGGTIVVAAAVARALAGDDASVPVASDIGRTRAIVVRRLRTPSGTLLSVDGAPVEELFADAQASRAAALWQQVLHRPVFTGGYIVAAGGLTLLYSIARDGASLALAVPSRSASSRLLLYDTHGALRQAIAVGAGETVRVFIAWRSYALLPTTAALATSGSPIAPASDIPVQSVHPAAAPLPTDPVPRRPGAMYFPSHGHNLSGPFLAFWRKYGGIPTFGEPRTEIITWHGQRVQFFDRFLLDLVNGKVQAGPLGVLLSKTNPDPAFKRQPKCPGPRDLYVAETGHCILFGRFLTFWQSHRALLGAPISELTVESNGDRSGRTYELQWFQNGRLEYHPENATPAHMSYVMELGLLGIQYLRSIGWLPPVKHAA